MVFTPSHRSPLLSFPQQFELGFENVIFHTDDNVELKGWLIPASQRTERTLIVLHGWSDNKGDALSRYRFLAANFNLLLFDSRAHGESGGTRVTLGCLEALDIDAAIAFLKKERPEWTKNLGVMGLSMGAVIGVGALARHKDLRCGVLESPFLSYNEVIRQFAWSHYRLPFFPFAWLTIALIRWRLGRDPEFSSPLYHAEKIAPAPVLIIAGEQDQLMPLAIVEAVYKLITGPKEIWVIAGASHGLCQETAGPEYARRITHFFDKNL
jgi:pimeloyl-ACP methyl ester carboxylesterase